jgi:prophage regulatory protein
MNEPPQNPDRTVAAELRQVLPGLSYIATPARRTLRRAQLREMVPLADTTIYEMEQRGEFPRRFNLTPRCVVWDLAEVEAWIKERRRASQTGSIKPTPGPDVRRRRTRPVRTGPR